MIRVNWSDHAESALYPAAGNKANLDYVRREVVRGLADLWRFDDDVKGYAVTRSVQNDTGLELVLVLGAGAGAASFIKRMVIYAAKSGFDSVRSHVFRPGLIRLYSKADFKNVGRDDDGYHVMRRQDGRQK